MKRRPAPQGCDRLSDNRDSGAHAPYVPGSTGASRGRFFGRMKAMGDPSHPERFWALRLCRQTIASFPPDRMHLLRSVFGRVYPAAWPSHEWRWALGDSHWLAEASYAFSESGMGVHGLSPWTGGRLRRCWLCHCAGRPSPGSLPPLHPSRGSENPRSSETLQALA